MLKAALPRKTVKLLWSYHVYVGRISKLKKYEPGHSKIACAPMTRLIRVFAIRIKTLMILGYPQTIPRRLQSGCANAQADLSLRRAHVQSCRKCCAPAYISVIAIITQGHQSNVSLRRTFHSRLNGCFQLNAITLLTSKTYI